MMNGLQIINAFRSKRYSEIIDSFFKTFSQCELFSGEFRILKKEEDSTEITTCKHPTTYVEELIEDYRFDLIDALQSKLDVANVKSSYHTVELKCGTTVIGQLRYAELVELDEFLSNLLLAVRQHRPQSDCIPWEELPQFAISVNPDVTEKYLEKTSFLPQVASKSDGTEVVTNFKVVSAIKEGLLYKFKLSGAMTKESRKELTTKIEDLLDAIIIAKQKVLIRDLPKSDLALRVLNYLF